MSDSTLSLDLNDPFEWAVHEVSLIKSPSPDDRNRECEFATHHERIGHELRGDHDRDEVLMITALRRAHAAVVSYAQVRSQYTSDNEINRKFFSVAGTLDQLVRTFRQKQADYSPFELDAGPWKNFIDTARHIGVTPGIAVELLIELKRSRLASLLAKCGDPVNESLVDTYLDCAVYCLIAVAMLQDGEY